MNNSVKRTRALPLLLLVLMLIVSMPITALAAPEDNITVEFRYTEGDPYDIPDSYIFAGRTFVLLNQEPPVLESTLPIMRTYHYRIWGDLTEDDMKYVDPNVRFKFTPVSVVYDREIERFETLTKFPDGSDLTNNDVDELCPTGMMNYPITPDETVQGIVSRSALELASIEYSVREYEIGTLPKNYTAEVVFKGLESYNAYEYTSVDATYERTDQVGDVNVYVVVATYEPTDLITPTPAGEEAGLVPLPAAEVVIDEPTTTVPEADVPLSDGQPSNPVQGIVDNQVPLGNTSQTNAWSLLSLILSVIAVCIGVFALMQIFMNRRSDEEIADESKGTDKIFHLVACLMGIVTLVVWLFKDSIGPEVPYVWVNKFTPIVGIMLMITVLAFVIARLRSGSRQKNLEAEA